MAGSNGKPTLRYGAAALAFMAVAVLIMAAACTPESRHGDGTDALAMPPTVNHVPAALETIDNRRQSLWYAECLTETLSWRETTIAFDEARAPDIWATGLVQRCRHREPPQRKVEVALDQCLRQQFDWIRSRTRSEYVGAIYAETVCASR